MNSIKFNIQLTDNFKDNYSKLSKEIQNITTNKLKLLKNDIRHNSLQTKRIKGTNDLWEARINLNFRIIFKIIDHNIVLIAIASHDILDKQKFKDF